MPTVKIHQNIFGFEKKRKGFTRRQIAGFAGGAVLALSSFALFGYVLGLHFYVAGTIAFIFLTIPVICGFMPLAGMPAEEFAARLLAINKRGNVLIPEAESISQSSVQRQELSRAYKKSKKACGAECGK